MRESRKEEAVELVGRRVAVVLLLAGLVGCKSGPLEPTVEGSRRESLVCGPVGVTVTPADTVSVGTDGSCPVGFDVMIWT